MLKYRKSILLEFRKKSWKKGKQTKIKTIEYSLKETAMKIRIHIYRNKLHSPFLICSSIVFITNIITAYYKQDFIYSSLFFMLTITSVFFHSKPNIYYNIIDKISIFSVFLYGSYQLSRKISSEKTLPILLIVASFLATIYLFFYGFWFQNYCFHEDKQIANQYHALLHLIGSIGHHLIIFL